MAKLAIGLSSGTPTRMDFIEFTPTKFVKMLSDGSSKVIRGTLDHDKNSVAEGMLVMYFRTRMYMTAAKLAVLLPCLGFGVASTTFTLADSITDSTIVVQYPGAKEWTFSGCVPTDFVIHGQKGADPIMIDIGWVAKTWASATSGTFFTSQTSPAMTEGYVYPFGDGANNVSTIVVGSDTFAYNAFRLKCDFHTVVEFNNSVTATNICPTDHDITLATSLLYSTCDGTESIFETPMAGTVTGGAATLTFSTTAGSGNSTAIVLANAKYIAQPPAIKKADFVRLPVNLRGYASGTTKALVITNSAS